MRIVIADAQPRVRYALRVLLERQPDVEVVGEAADIEGLVDQTETADPDMIVLDWGLARSRPEELLSELRRSCSDLRVLALSGRPEEQIMAVDAGVDAFACKCDSAQRLLAAIDLCRQRSSDRE